jgi:hypothetical protein
MNFTVNLPKLSTSHFTRFWTEKEVIQSMKIRARKGDCNVIERSGVRFQL